MEIDKFIADFQRCSQAADFCSVRLHREQGQNLSMRKGVLQPSRINSNLGYMLTVYKGGAAAYAASSDTSAAGLDRAFRLALSYAEMHAKDHLLDYKKINFPSPTGEFSSPVKSSWETLAFKDKIDLLADISQQTKIHPNIVEWQVSLWRDYSERWFLTNKGGRVRQVFDRLMPRILVIASDGRDSQSRSFGHEATQQVGLEFLDELNFRNMGKVVAEEALQLLSAENCPAGKMDILLDPEQMVLQIHESIGHPLELDRILGDERNFAGTSFVTPDMFGTYQYGSELLNITYDPENPRQVASYNYDDDGLKAEKTFIIKNGRLEKPLGGLFSQARSSMSGVACGRADTWQRPAIDRMVNLNLESGKSSFAQMIAMIERGVYMRTNRSWSIDDSRNKFQFGCEWGQLIENGQLTKIVKNPNYRGISASFWRNLAAVGDRDTLQTMGTPFCGKGEPNQVIFVGHATPACLFRDIDVFGGV